MKEFDEAMAKAKEQLKVENYICERVYDVVENATNEGEFLIDDGFSIGLTQSKETDRKTILVMIGDDEYEIAVHKVSHD